MRAWVGTPQMEEALGGRMLVANRNDGFSVMMPMATLTPERMAIEIDSYLDNGCTCDSTLPGRRCSVHREACFA